MMIPLLMGPLLLFLQALLLALPNSLPLIPLLRPSRLKRRELPRHRRTRSIGWRPTALPQWAQSSFTHGFPGSAFVPQPDGTLRCPAGHPLFLQERREDAQRFA